MNEAERNRVIARAVTMSLTGIVALYTAYLIRDVLLMLYVSSLLALGLSPVVRRIESSRFMLRRKRVPRWLAILTIYIAFLFVVAIVLLLTLPPLIAQVRELATNMPSYMDRLLHVLSERGLIKRQTSWTTLLPELQQPGVIVMSLFGALQGAVGVFGTLITVIILPFYLLLESASLQSMYLGLIRPENRARAKRIATAATTKVGAWLGGQLLLGIVMGTTATIGFWVIGVPYFYVLGLVAALGEMIPVVGPILATIPAVFLGWTVSPQTALITLLYCWAAQFVENNFLVPRIMQRQVGVSPVTIIVALLIGSTLLGLAGAILAVPTAAIVQVIVHEHFVREDDVDAK